MFQKCSIFCQGRSCSEHLICAVNKNHGHAVFSYHTGHCPRRRVLISVSGETSRHYFKDVLRYVTGCGMSEMLAGLQQKDQQWIFMTVVSRQVQHLHTQTHDTHKRPHCGRAVHDTPQNYVTLVLQMRWIESFICQMRRGRQGGERGQRKDRCQSLCVPVCVCKREKKIQRFSDTEVNFLSVMEGKELWRMSGLVSRLCMTCLESIRSDLSADRFFSAGKH